MLAHYGKRKTETDNVDSGGDKSDAAMSSPPPISVPLTPLPLSGPLKSYKSQADAYFYKMTPFTSSSKIKLSH